MERDTRQRRAIRDSLEAAGRPLGVQEILDAASERAPGLTLATVYRTLRALTDGGRLQPVSLPGEPARYEIAGKAHHHHFHCRACGRVFEVDCGPAEHKVPPGFRLERHEVVLYGQCDTCADRAA